MPRSSPPTIPTFLSVDVEPDGFQLSGADPPPWTGYAETFAFAGRLRSALEQRTGATPAFGWYFRTDPQVAEVYGRGDYILSTFPERVAELEDNGDYLGAHCHPLRWSSERGAWLHDVGDDDWIAQCTQHSLDHFARWQGAPTRRFRWGASFVSNTTTEVLDANGVTVDLTLEPVSGWALREPNVLNAIDGAAIVGSYVDCAGAPRTPYRPSYADFRVAATNGDARTLTMIPLTTVTPRRGGPRWRQLARRIKGSSLLRPEVLYPTADYSDPRQFWDLAERELKTIPTPYLSFAIRTDAAGSTMLAAVERVFMALSDHPLSERLRFVDPIAALAEIS